MIPHDQMGPTIRANKEIHNAHVSIREPHSVMVRIAIEGALGEDNHWVTGPEFLAFDYTPHPDQTSEYHTGPVTYAEVVAGAVPWMSVMYRRPYYMTEAEKTSKRAWMRMQDKIPMF